MKQNKRKASFVQKEVARR